MVLHDSVGATLALAKMRLGSSMSSHASSGNGGGERVNGNGSLKMIVDLIDDALQRTRTLTTELSPPVLYELGLEAAVRWLADRFEEQHGLHVNVASRGPRPALLEEETRLVLFHAVRELLVNVVKHAGVDECEVTLCYGGDEQIVIEVSDAGAGFDVVVGGGGGGGRPRPGPSSPGAAELNDDGGGFGLFNITQRITHIGGGVEVLAQPGSGTTVTLTVPKSRSSNTKSGERS